MTAFTTSELTKRYGSVTALTGLDLTVEDGSFHGIVGPNGSGKTTLLHLVAGLANPTTGSIEGPDGPVGFSFQEPRFFPALTVQENLEVFATLADATVSDGWIDTVSAGIRLDPVRHRQARHLSGGFRTKLDLALALVNRPSIVMVDEPLADVDGASRDAIRSFLTAYHAEGRTVVLATHNVDAFLDRLDRITVLVDGRVRADGPTGTTPLEPRDDASI